MRLQFVLALVLVGMCCVDNPVRAQQRRANVQPTGVSRVAFQDDDDQAALAKQMDNFHQRIKALENGAKKLVDDQADGSFIDQIGETKDGVKDNAEAIEKIDDELPTFVLSGHGGAPKMKLSGRIHLDYWNFADNDPGIALLEGGDPQDRFGFRRLRFGVKGNLPSNMFYKIEMEFAGANNTEYRDAFIGFNDLPWFKTVIIGNHKRPYGLDHLNSSRNNVFIERPFIVEAFNQDSRRLGISSNGVSDDQQYNWRFGVWAQELTQTTFGYIGDSTQPEFAGRMANTWWWDEASDGRGYGHVAVSGSYGRPDGLGANNQARYRTRPEARSTNRWLDTGTIAGAESFILGGVEGVLNVGPLQIVGEYQAVEMERFGAFGPSVQFNGGYAQVSYFLTGEHMPWDRTTGTLGRVKPFENFFSVCDCDGFIQRGIGAWQVAARYSYADLTDQNINGGRGDSITFATNWYLTPYSRFQFNYIVGDIDRGVAGVGDYQIIGARFMVDF